VAVLVACRMAQRPTRSDSHDEAISVRPPCWVARYPAKQVRRRARSRARADKVHSALRRQTEGGEQRRVPPLSGVERGQLRRGRDSLRCSPATHPIDAGTDLRNGQVLLWTRASRDDEITVLDGSRFRPASSSQNSCTRSHRMISKSRAPSTRRGPSRKRPEPPAQPVRVSYLLRESKSVRHETLARFGG